jgi:uncharacterized SAM-dependent methyltransferase
VLSKDIEVLPVRNLSYEDAEKEITTYLKNAGKRRVYVSEIVEKLRLDIELASEIVYKWREKMCKDTCEEDGYNRYGTSYKCPITSCMYNNHYSR